jgi:hypothetical protein
MLLRELILIFLPSEQLGVQFVTFLLNYIEQPPQCDTLEQLPDVFLRLLLSLNLQFRDPNENVLLQALAKCTLAQAFTEKSLLLFNREGKNIMYLLLDSRINHFIVFTFKCETCHKCMHKKKKNK